jgi:glycogen operon protein
MMATLLLSQGTPMILAGDELGNSQGGNNNAYNQDNATAWIDWDNIDEAFLATTRQLIAFRKSHPILRQKLFLHSRERMIDGVEDLFWWREDGQAMQTLDWHDPSRHLIAVEKRTAAGTPVYAAREYAILMIFNAGDEKDFVLPPAPTGQLWSHEIDTGKEGHVSAVVRTPTLQVGAQSVSALVLIEDTGGG